MKSKRMKRGLSFMLALCLVMTALPVFHVHAADTNYCTYCGRYAAYTVQYVSLGAYSHRMQYYCSYCYQDQLGGSGPTHEHVYAYMDPDYDVCTYCGYAKYIGRGNTTTCSHPSTRTSWNGCTWSLYCTVCRVEISYGSSHTFNYGTWEYSNENFHKRTNVCTVCGYTEWPMESHQHVRQADEYNYTTGRHSVTILCTDCGHVWSSYDEPHNCEPGAWSFEYGASVHYRLQSCVDCQYAYFERADHEFVNQPWQKLDAQEHSRKVECSVCGYYTMDYAYHSYVKQSAVSISDTQHRITERCDCGDERTIDAAHVDANGDGVCDDCGYVTTRFSVTIPASLALAVNEYGVVSTATNAAIVNNSTAAVKVTSVTASTSNGWTLVPFDSSMASAKVDSKQIGFQLNDAGSARTGTSETLSIGSGWSISKGASLPLRYDAIVSATSEAIRGERVLTLLFVVDWA